MTDKARELAREIEDHLSEIGRVVLAGIPEGTGFIFHANDVRIVLQRLQADTERGKDAEAQALVAAAYEAVLQHRMEIDTEDWRLRCSCGWTSEQINERQVADTSWRHIISLTPADARAALDALIAAKMGEYAELLRQQHEEEVGDAVESGLQIVKDLTERLLKMEQSVADRVKEAVEPLESALREVNSLQHKMAIELDPIPQQPRIEHWTRQIEKVVCDALEAAAIRRRE